MERRLAVHAGSNPQALICGGRWVWLIGAVLAVLASSAEARPKRRDARVAFDRGVAAYKQGKFEAASESLGKSFELERDVDTLFAWAQSERKLEHCDKAIELYEKLLTFNLPAANKNAVALKLTECRTIIAEHKPRAEPVPIEPPAVAPPPPPPAEPRPQPPEPPPRVAVRATVLPDPPPEQPTVELPWYKDQVAIGLLGLGVIGTGVGTGFLLSAHSLDGQSKSAGTFDEAQGLGKQAKSRGNIGLVAAGAGGALLVGGVVWIVTHRHQTEQRAVTGWLGPDGGGIAVAGAF